MFEIKNHNIFNSVTSFPLKRDNSLMRSSYLKALGSLNNGYKHLNKQGCQAFTMSKPLDTIKGVMI